MGCGKGNLELGIRLAEEVEHGKCKGELEDWQQEMKCWPERTWDFGSGGAGNSVLRNGMLGQILGCEHTV